jgi:hypothetical protein
MIEESVIRSWEPETRNRLKGKDAESGEVKPGSTIPNNGCMTFEGGA